MESSDKNKIYDDKLYSGWEFFNSFVYEKNMGVVTVVCEMDELFLKFKNTIYREFAETVKLPRSVERYPYHDRFFNQFQICWIWFKSNRMIWGLDWWNEVFKDFIIEIVNPMVDYCATSSNLSECVKGYYEFQKLGVAYRHLNMNELLKHFKELLYPVTFSQKEDAKLLESIVRGMHWFTGSDLENRPYSRFMEYSIYNDITAKATLEPLIRQWMKKTDKDQCNNFLNDHIIPGQEMRPFSVQFKNGIDPDGIYFILITFTSLVLRDFANINFKTFRIVHGTDTYGNGSQSHKWTMIYVRHDDTLVQIIWGYKRDRDRGETSINLILL